MTDRLQVVLSPAQDFPRIASVPAVLRAAQRVAAELAPARLVVSGTDAGFGARWSRQLAGLGGGARAEFCPPAEAASRAAGAGSVLAVSAEGLASAGALSRFLARAAGRPARWLRRGAVLASYHPDPAAYPGGAGGAQDVEAADGDWLPLAEAGAVSRAEAELFASLIKDNDGFIARLDRRLSIRVSRLLLGTPVAPNHITTASLVLGLLGAAALALGSYPVQVLGAFALWFCCILDGCDGEVARLKLLCSKSGADYDLSADHIAHLAIFVAIPFAVRGAEPGARVLAPGLFMVSGLLACMFTVWWLILRRPEQVPDEVQLFFERVASRDYVYLILLLTVIHRLHWFLWAAAFGAHLFNLALWWLFLRRPRRAPAA